MKTMNLFLMDMACVGMMNGVTRYLDVLVRQLAGVPACHVTWIRLVWDKKLLGIRRTICEKYTQITVPLPQDINRLLGNPDALQDYNRVVFHLLEEDFAGRGNCILHIHTLNLIDFALYARERIPCKVITHLHCIPWKGLYNTDRNRFNELYRKYYGGTEGDGASEFISRPYELRSYLLSDAVVCVTSCARDFILRYCHIPSSRVWVIYNGMDDVGSFGQRQRDDLNKPVECLYVGNMNESKGLRFVLDALREVRKICPVALTVAGRCTQKQKERWQEEYPDIAVNFTGLIPFEELKRYYVESDIGLIASLQEQCSYVALEMMMSGLPVVTTNADGLDELFVQEGNALKIAVRYNADSGLTVDSKEMAYAVLRLIDDGDLRRRIGCNARKDFVRQYTARRMTDETLALYQAVLADSQENIKSIANEKSHIERFTSLGK